MQQLSSQSSATAPLTEHQPPLVGPYVVWARRLDFSQHQKCPFDATGICEPATLRLCPVKVDNFLALTDGLIGSFASMIEAPIYLHRSRHETTLSTHLLTFFFSPSCQPQRYVQTPPVRPILKDHTPHTFLLSSTSIIPSDIPEFNKTVYPLVRQYISPSLFDFPPVSIELQAP